MGICTKDNFFRENGMEEVRSLSQILQSKKVYGSKIPSSDRTFIIYVIHPVILLSNKT